ncbi:MAG: aspartate carbamoyltransferase catalytic subunit [Acidobacteriota bacterium]|nr:aspartate carbamoyltransferase catalytic subunit [Acidobacteriota bacterium]
MKTESQRKHLLGIGELTAEEITHVLDTAEGFRDISRREIKKVPTLRGRTIINLFFEPSTRTRTSFEIAGKRLSADTINISSAASSVTKGETLLDTARNLEAMSPDFIVIRHPASGAPHALARICRAAVINAGDGAHEHPTQALLDALTIRQHKGRIEGLEVAILGDILHSRVARSNTHLLTKLGARVRLAGPGTLAPPEFASLVEAGEVRIANRVEEAIEGADVVMVLRIQRERQESAFFPSLREYAVHFGLNRKRLDAARPVAIVMHPGPMNRGIEIASDVADGARSLILDQVANGLAVRMAVLYLLDTGSLLGQREVETAKSESALAETFEAGSRTREEATQTQLPLEAELEPVHAAQTTLESVESPRRFRAHRPKTNRATDGRDGESEQLTTDDGQLTTNDVSLKTENSKLKTVP